MRIGSTVLLKKQGVERKRKQNDIFNGFSFFSLCDYNDYNSDTG